jgi:hypothetical protein
MTKDIQPFQNNQHGSSPFDKIKHVDPDGIEYWLARELGRELGYTTWRRIEGMLERAKVSCRTQGQDPEGHFQDFDSAGKLVQFGKGGKVATDVQLSRFGCYMASINGDVRKPQVAAAQGYFVTEKRIEELRRVEQIPGEWSVRLRTTLTPHLCDVNVKHPGCFTVMTATFAFILTLEDEIIRHKMLTLATDLPDGSIGQCWANDRRMRGLATTDFQVPLYMPARGFYVPLRVYGNDERGTFEAWFYRTYLPTKLPEYLINKPSLKGFNAVHCSSVAENVCQKLTAKPAHLRPPHRKLVNLMGGFVPAGMVIPELRHDQPRLFS